MNKRQREKKLKRWLKKELAKLYIESVNYTRPSVLRFEPSKTSETKV
jgi:hypothetical protein